MRRRVLWGVGALILLFVVDGVWAQKQGQEPNLQAEPNGRAAEVNQQRLEQLRQQARERMRQRALQRRSGEAGLRRTLDANAPAGAKGRDELVDKTIAGSAQRQQQLAAVEQQIVGEENKHRDRTARLNRIRELAQQQNNADIIARVDKLVGKEKQRYGAKMQRVRRRKEMVIEFSQRDAPAQGGADANKDSNQPPANEPVENK